MTIAGGSPAPNWTVMTLLQRQLCTQAGRCGRMPLRLSAKKTHNASPLVPISALDSLALLGFFFKTLNTSSVCDQICLKLGTQVQTPMGAPFLLWHVHMAHMSQWGTRMTYKFMRFAGFASSTHSVPANALATLNCYTIRSPASDINFVITK